MAQKKFYLDDEELDFVNGQPDGWLRTVVRRFMDVGQKALSPDELVYLRDHGGTKGVIALAKGNPDGAQTDPATGHGRAEQAISPEEYKRKKESK